MTYTLPKPDLYDAAEDVECYSAAQVMDAYKAGAESRKLECTCTAPNWQPIETAPKDFVTVFDGWNGDRVCDVSWAHPEYSQKGYYAFCASEYTNGHGWGSMEVKGLTHWMPIPNGPEADTKGEK